MAVFCPGAVIVPLQGMQDDLCPIAYPNCTLIDFIDMERSYRRPLLFMNFLMNVKWHSS